MTADVPPLSVVIPTIGRPILLRTLQSLIRTESFERIEVIIAGRIHDPTVRDEVGKLCAWYPQIQHLDVVYDTGDSSRKKNAGFQASRAEIVAFLDDDVEVAPDWPERMVIPFQDPKVGLVSGPGLIPDNISLMGRLAGLALSSRAAGYVAYRYRKDQDHAEPIRWSRIIGCNMAYRRKVFESIGQFDPSFWPGEEMIASHKAEQAGHRLMFYPMAYVYHYPRQSFWRFMKQMYGYGATRVRLFRGGVEFEPTTIVPALWVLSLLVLGIGSFFYPAAHYLFLADLLLYLLVDTAIVWDRIRGTQKTVDWLLLLIVPCMHISYGIAEWVEVFRPNRDLSDQQHH